MLARVENGRAKTLAENSPVNIAALVDFVEYTLDDIKGIMAEPSVLQKKTEIFLERDIYPLLKNFPASEKFSLCQEIKQSCYKLIRAAVMANNLTNVNRRLMWLDEADAEKTLLLVLLGVAKNQKYITQKKLLELQGKLEEIGRIIGGLQKFFINNRK